MNLRILFLLTQDLESPSGVGRYYPLARELSRLGHQVHIAALHSDFKSLQTSRFYREGVDVWYVAPMHVLKTGDQKYYYPGWQLLSLALRGVSNLTKAALRIPVDVIHIGKPHPMNGAAGFVAQVLKGRTVFVDCDDWEAASNRFTAGWQRWGVEIFENWIPRHAHHVTTNTCSSRDRLIMTGVSEEKITYLPNGLDQDRFLPPNPEKVSGLRASLGLAGKRVVAFIGSLSAPSHPVSLLLEAFTSVRDACPEAVLLIVGGGEDLLTLKEMVERMGLGDSVRFTGRVPAEEVACYYRLAHTLVDPVYNDDAARGRLPLKLFESWASETPFVTGDAGDRRMILGDPPAGALALPGEASSFAAEILRVLADHEYADSLRKRGLEYVREYTWDRLAQKMEEVYRKYVHLTNG